MRTPILLFLTILSRLAFSQETALVRTFGGPGNEIAYSMAVMPDSGLILGGVTNHYGAGGNSIYVVRTNKSGVHRWSAVYGGSQIDRCNKVIVTGDSAIFLIGYTNSFGNGGYDGLVIKLDTAGNEQWSKAYGGSDWDFFNSGVMLADGSLVLCGNTYSNGADRSDAFALHIDQDGNSDWQIQFGTNNDESINDVTTNGTHLFFAGSTGTASAGSGYMAKTELNGTGLQTFTYSIRVKDEFRGITVSNGDLVLAGVTAQDTLLLMPWFCKLDTAGNKLWEHTFTRPSNSYFNAVAAIQSGQIAYTGQDEFTGLGGKVMYMVRTDAGGQWQAGPSFGGPQDEEGFAVLPLPDNKIAFCGYTTSWGLGNEDMLLVILPQDTLGMNYTLSNIYYSEQLSPIGFDDPKTLHCNVYPNPAGTYLNIRCIENDLAESFILYSVTGQKTDLTRSLKNESIDLRGLEKGFYTYRLTSKGKVITGKLIIE